MVNEEVNISTIKKVELVNITAEINQIVDGTNISEGLCHVFVPHATAAVLINEDEPGFKADIQKLINIWIPEGDWEHNQIDSNATSHLASSLIGQSRTIPILNNKLALGTWQEIFLVELDGPRQNRKVLVQII